MFCSHICCMRSLAHHHCFTAFHWSECHCFMPCVYITIPNAFEMLRTMLMLHILGCELWEENFESLLASEYCIANWWEVRKVTLYSCYSASMAVLGLGSEGSHCGLIRDKGELVRLVIISSSHTESDRSCLIMTYYNYMYVWPWSMAEVLGQPTEIILSMYLECQWHCNTENPEKCPRQQVTLRPASHPMCRVIHICIIVSRVLVEYM